MTFKIRNGIIAFVVYAWFLLSMAVVTPILAILAILYCGACMWVTRSMIADARARRSGAAIEFSEKGALNVFGQEWSSFHHVFASDKPVTDAFQKSLATALHEKIGCGPLEAIVIKDVDRELPSPESRTFHAVQATRTSRATDIVLVCTFTRTGTVQGIRWWILVSGVHDPNKVFWRYALSPLMVPAVILRYRRRSYDPLHGLDTVYSGFFNAVDLLNQTRELQYVAFETLVETLESFGIDTSDLKLQRGNIMNINVTGGRTNFGSVVQGAMNRVTGAAGGGAT